MQNFTFLEIISFFYLFIFFCIFTFIYQNFIYVTVYRTIEIVKDCSCALPLLNMLMYSKIIKLFVHVQNMPTFYTLLIEVDFILSRIKHIL